MSNLSSEDYKALIPRLNACFALLRSKLAGDAAEHVSHYLEHGEPEMAYESLVLSHIREGVGCDRHVADELRSIGTELNMETEAVFEANFWKLAQEYFASASNSPPTPDS
jgi:hypothetical protein